MWNILVYLSGDFTENQSTDTHSDQYSETIISHQSVQSMKQNLMDIGSPIMIVNHLNRIIQI